MEKKSAKLSEKRTLLKERISASGEKKKVKGKKSEKTDYLPFNRFAAIDFETADFGRDSACAISLVVVEKGIVVEKAFSLIKPPRREFVFTYLHGISWADVADKPLFHQVWEKMASMLDGVEFVAAHNASFDRNVLYSCCDIKSTRPPELPFLCTMKLSRGLWDLYPTKLSDVCKHFRIPLKHHDAASDAMACAHIVLQAKEIGIPAKAFLQKPAVK